MGERTKQDTARDSARLAAQLPESLVDIQQIRPGEVILVDKIEDMDYEQRKATPIATGVLDYFPDALAEVAHASLAGNKQHLEGQRLHWDRSLSTDEDDALIRHFLARGRRDTDGVRHSAKVAWRALALLQKEIESDNNKT